MKSRGFLKLVVKSLEVEANCASDLTTIDEYQELRLYASIEVILDKGCQIAINFDVCEVLELVASVLVVLFEGGDHRVPFGREVEECECRSLLIEVLNHLVEVLWDL